MVLWAGPRWDWGTQSGVLLCSWCPCSGFVSNRDRETGETQAISTFLSTRKDFQLQGEGKLSLIPPFALLICYLVLQNCVEKVNSWAVFSPHSLFCINFSCCCCCCCCRFLLLFGLGCCYFFFCSWDKSETNPSTLTSWSLEKLKQQRRPTPFIKEGSSQSGTRGSSLGRRVAAALPWKRQDCQDTVPCPCLSCMQLLTWCQTMGEMMRKDTFFFA